MSEETRQCAGCGHLISTRVCLDCGLEKPFSKFPRRSQARLGVVPYCKECSTLRNREKWKKNRKRYNANRKQREEEKIKEWLRNKKITSE